METLLYLLIASVSVSMCYGAYLLIYNNSIRFMQQRMFLIAAACISMLVPLLPQRIDLGFSLASLFQPVSDPSLLQEATQGSAVIPGFLAGLGNGNARLLPGWLTVTGLIWLAVFLLLLIRAGIMLGVIGFRAWQAKRTEGFRIVRSNRPTGPYSFFRIIFLPDRLIDPVETEQVIAHEKIHALQWHSVDRLVFELLTALMWFNPLVWKMKQSLTLVHEYLADEGALKSGIDRVYYQALLVNQVAGAPLIPLSSRFNHSLVKKRILMMTQTKTPRTSRLRILAIAPLTIGILVIAACLNGLFAQPGTNNSVNQRAPENQTSKPDTAQSLTQKTIPANILYIVDGKESAAETIQTLDPNTIESVNVIKDKEMIKKYTDKKVEGVILITLKAKAK